MARRDDRSGSRRNRSASPNAMVSSASVLTRARQDQPQLMGWQGESWDVHEVNGELRSAVRWNGSALSRARLIAARRPEKAGDEPTPAESGTLPFDLMESLAGGIGRQSSMLRSFGVHLWVPGEGYLIGTVGADGQDWGVYSADEIETMGETWYVKTGEEVTDRVMLDAESLVVRLWTPNERYHWKPDSPTKGALVPLREISDIDDTIHAQAESRLSGAGVFLIASEVVVPQDPRWKDSPDPLTEMFMLVAETARQNRDSAAAKVPIILRVPGEHIEHCKHITFATPFDERALETREAAIRRAATAMDLPAEIILGLGDVNHWGAWQIEEAALKMHIEPELEAICAGLTYGFLWPTMRAMAATGEVEEWIVWYDTSELTTRPDKSDSVTSAYDRMEASGMALRRELGLSEDDKPSPNELREMIAKKLVRDGADQQLVMDIMGLLSDRPMGPIDTTGAPAVEPAAEPDTRTIPETDDVTPDEASGPMTAAAVAAMTDQAMFEACEGLTLRAMEKAGNRLRQALKQHRRPAPADVDSAEVHCHTGVDPTSLAPLDALLAGAWDRVTAVADRYDAEPEPLVRVLDAYARSLIASGQPHSWERMTMALGSVSKLPPPSAVIITPG